MPRAGGSCRAIRRAHRPGMRKVSDATAAVANDAEEVKNGGRRKRRRRLGPMWEPGGSRGWKITILGCEKAKKTARKRAIQCNFEPFPSKK